MGLLDTFGTDRKKETEGTWIDIVKNDDGTICRMKILRMGQSNRQFLKRYAALQKKYRIGEGKIPTELEVEAIREAFVETVLVDWEYVEDIRGKTGEGFPVVEGNETAKYMPFSRPNAILLFKTLPDLFDFVVGEATKRENFQNEVNEELAKN